MANDDQIAALEAQLTGLTGTARTYPLLQLGQIAADAYWRVGPGTGAALPYLVKALAAMEEGYGYLQADDPQRGRTAAGIGFLLAARESAHGGSDQDRERAIPLLEEALESTALPAVLGDGARFFLGQLYLSRVLKSFQMTDFVSGAARLAQPGANADLARARVHTQAVVDGSGIPDAVRHARVLLSLIETFETLLSGFTPGGFDMSRMMEAMGRIQTLMSAGVGMPGSGMPGSGPPGSGPPAFGASASGVMPVMPLAGFAQQWADMDPIDRPIAVAHAPGAVYETDADPEVVRQPSIVVDVDAMRRELRGMLPEGADVYASVVSLLRSDSEGGVEGAVEGIDDLVALAASVAAGGDAATGTDHLLLAVAYLLRSRRDEGGWGTLDDEPSGGDGNGNGDAEAAVASLLTAAETLPLEALDSVPALVFLATLLPGGALEGLAGRLADVTAALKAVGADAVVFPEPVEAWLLNVGTGRIEPVAAYGEAERVVVVGDGRPALRDEAIVSPVASLTQLRELSQRPARLVTEDAVFLVNPRGDREAEAVQAMLVRRSFYPRSTGFGRLLENIDGPGTASGVRTRLDASLLHLSCGITAAGALELADSAELDLAGVTVPRGGLVILPPGHDQPLAGVLLDAGFTGVVGWAHPVPEPVAALMLFVLHEELADRGCTPSEAVAEVGRWLRDRRPRALPSLLAGHVERLGEDADHARTAMIYRGR